jgi:hypothetical protein
METDFNETAASDTLLTERNIWRGAATVAIGLLLVMMFQAWSERRGTTRPRVDEPGAAVTVPLREPLPTFRSTRLLSLRRLAAKRASISDVTVTVGRYP